MIHELIKIANDLDEMGHYALASEIDKIISIASRDTDYYLIDENWQIVPQTGYANREEDAFNLYEHHDGMYSLVKRITSPMERREKIIQKARDFNEQSEDPPPGYEEEY